MATQLPVASVHQYDAPENSTKTVALPQVFRAPFRTDLVRMVFTGMNKNRRQAHGVKYEAGYDTAAISWGTGRAVARIPRVPGGGTHRSGQGAFGNMCRGGGMFNPLKTWRRWHRKVNTTQKRHALACAISATAVAPLVMARGHSIDNVPEIPLVVSEGAESIQKTKQAVELLKGLGVESELEKVADSKKIRAGRGKARNRRYVMRRGPLVVYAKDNGIAKSFRNIPGVDLCSVERLNLLQLAPGGTFGRFVIWTEGAMKRLGELFGTYKGGSAEKVKYTLPRPMMTNTDISRIINSNEVQSVLKAAKEAPKVIRQKKNPLKNRGALAKLCPGALAQKRVAALAHKKGSKVQVKIAAKKAKHDAKKKVHDKTAKKVFFKNLMGAYASKVETSEE